MLHLPVQNSSAETESAAAGAGIDPFRRNFVRAALAATAGAAAIPISAVTASAQSISASQGSPPAGYGTLQPVTGVSGVNRMLLLSSFTVQVLAAAGQTIPGTGLTYRSAPDGAATFPDGAGGWYYTVNHEISNGGGGVTSFHFNSSGGLIDAQSILSGTNRNCAGGPTPWGTWLSCEENIGGASNSGQTSLVWECWPDNSQPGISRPAMGTRNHEAVAADPINRVLYITEDTGIGKLWRFTPTVWGDLSSGTLEEAQTSNSNGTGSVTWVSSGGRKYNGGEGIWYHQPTRKVYMATKGDDTVWELDTANNQMRRVWQGSNSSSSPLYEPDNLTVAESGDLYVAEDDGELRVVLITASGELSTFLQFTGGEHGNSEVTGPVFNPAGDTMYVSSQRGGPNGSGITYAITGPFRSTASPTPTATAIPPTVTPTAIPPTIPPTATAIPPTVTPTAAAAAIPPTAIPTAAAAAIPPTVTPTAIPPTVTAIPPTAIPTATATPRPGGPLSGAFTLFNRGYRTWLTEPSAGSVRHQQSQNRNGQWRIVPLSNGNVHIINAVTGRWLDTDGTGGQVIDTSSSPSVDDEWKPTQLANGAWVFESVAYPGRWLDADYNGYLRLWRDNDPDAQWTLTPVAVTVGVSTTNPAEADPGEALRTASLTAAEQARTVTEADTGALLPGMVAGAAIGGAMVNFRNRRREDNRRP